MLGGRELRQFVRCPATLDASISVTDGREARQFAARTRDISIGGACLTVHEHIEDLVSVVKEDETRLSVDIQLPGGASLAQLDASPAWSHASVDWMRKPAEHDEALLMGIRFWHVPDQTKDLIAAFVRGHLSEK
jgi:c-di-GMP-binding flagellar brake protein YcgR